MATIDPNDLVQQTTRHLEKIRGDTLQEALNLKKRARTFEKYKEAFVMEAKGRRIKNARKPVPYNGNEFDANATAQQKLIGKLTYAQATGKDSDSSWSVGWKTANNEFVQLSYTDLENVVTAVNNQIQAAYNREAELLSQIENASSVSDLEAINMTSGWP
jgi:hypothetical protein